MRANASARGLRARALRERAQKILCANAQISRACAGARTRAIFQSESNVITSEYMFTRSYSLQKKPTRFIVISLERSQHLLPKNLNIENFDI